MKAAKGVDLHMKRFVASPRFANLLWVLLLTAGSAIAGEMSRSDIDVSVSIDDFDDLDDAQAVDSAETKVPNNQFVTSPDDLENKKQLDTEDHSIDVTEPKPTRSNNILERFSQILTQQIIDRFQLPPQLQLPFRSKRERRKSKPGINSLTGNEGDDKSLVDISNVRKVGAMCLQPDDRAASDYDESLVVCEPDSSKTVTFEDCKVVPDDTMYGNSLLDHSDDDIQAGMIVYVLPSGESIDETIDTSISTSHKGNEPDMNGYNKQIASSRCIVEMGKRYDTNDQVIQYSLIRREPLELGNIDVHRKDFAYQPVVLSSAGWSSESSGLVEARIAPESEVVEALSTYDPGYSLADSTNIRDEQVSFRWFSWIDHLNEFFRHGKTRLNTDASNLLLDGAGVAIPGARYDHSAYDGSGSLYEEAGKHAFAGGSHGEIWRAKRRCPNRKVNCDDNKDFIVKRLKIELGYSVLEAGLREVYFGEMLAREAESSNLVTTYIDHFFREGRNGKLELWIVFENAGPSLRSYLYTPVIDANGGFTVFQHSSFWRRLRKGIKEQKKEEDVDFALDIIQPKSPLQQGSNNEKSHHEKDDNPKQNKHAIPEGRLLLKDVMKQIITSVAFLHERGIVHRDIKPSNIMCKTFPKPLNDLIPPRIESVNCLLGDFSSAWDDYSQRNLYASGPSTNDLTQEYSPPEVLLQQQGSSWSPFSFQNPYSYDSWSLGVVFLEMLLGTPNVFTVDQRTTVILTNKLKKEGASPNDIQTALYLAALSQFCIYVPRQGKSWPLRYGDPMHDAKVVKDTCTLRDFHNALRARDPLGTGFDESTDLLLHLIWKLLAWDPLYRLKPSQALQHPYFTAPTMPQSTHDNLPVERIILSSTFANYNPLFPGPHNALESQLLDANLDMNSSFAVSEFICPKCGKKHADHNSCQQHARSRRHALFCSYDRTALPHCLNAHTMLPHHPSSGYCDIQGRRRTIEDFHSVHLHNANQFYGIFDGHLGNIASKYAASAAYRVVEARISNIDRDILSIPDWKEIVKSNLEQSFEEIHRGIISAVTTSPGGVMDESGTTATIVYVTDLSVIIANVGDSRAVLSQWTQDSRGRDILSAVQLTVDHIASSHSEQELIAQRGGSVSRSGGIERVNGILAVSRSLGDISLAPFLSRSPHVLALTKTEVRGMCGAAAGQDKPCFLIAASDGLWDVMTNQEAVEMVQEAINFNKQGSAFQVAAEWLTQEAYVRGSRDNIGSLVVGIV